VWFGRARSCFAYEGKILEAIHGFKYLKRFDLLSVFMHYLVSEIDKMGHYDVLIPVPLHWQRLWGRGYNPSALLARSLGKKLGIEVDCHVLKKNKNIAPQVGLRRDARLKNIKGAFDIHSRRKTRIEGKKVLLIDDVLTTGATINECAKVLVKKGACELVDILTIARTI
jgi:ComF family protein